MFVEQIMSNSSSSSSSRSFGRRSVNGLPSRCWCGGNLITFTSTTNENPYRRFYRCEFALQRKSENHLFKWIDEALIEEIRMVDANNKRLVAEVKDLEKSLMGKMQMMQSTVEKFEEEVKEKVNKEAIAEVLKIEKELNERVYANVNARLAKMEEEMKEKLNEKMKNVGIVVLALGVFGWFWCKLGN